MEKGSDIPRTQGKIHIERGGGSLEACYSSRVGSLVADGEAPSHEVEVKQVVARTCVFRNTIPLERP